MCKHVVILCTAHIYANSVGVIEMCFSCDNIVIPVFSVSVLLSKFLNFSLPLESKLLVNWNFFLGKYQKTMQACDRNRTHTHTRTQYIHCIPKSISIWPCEFADSCPLCACNYYHYIEGFDGKMM